MASLPKRSQKTVWSFQVAGVMNLKPVGSLEGNAQEGGGGHYLQSKIMLWKALVSDKYACVPTLLAPVGFGSLKG